MKTATTKHGCGVEQPVARQSHDLEVAGSNPAPATTPIEQALTALTSEVRALRELVARPARAAFNLKEASLYSNLPIRSLRRLCRLRRIAFSKPARDILIRRQVLDAYLERIEVRRLNVLEDRHAVNR